jgi:hypothetical protein
MEVHAHTHTERKKWYHYFWEFLMLFLAVFCGFLAENIREHSVEKHREKEYMKEIVENLKYDTVRCSINAAANVEIALGLDSLRNEVKEAVSGKINGNALYYFTMRYTGNVGEAVFNTSAITELKNSGSLRLIDNKEIVASIADYYERKVFATNDYMPTKGQIESLQKTINDFFSLLYLDDYIQSFSNMQAKGYKNNYNYQDILELRPTLQLLNNDTKALERFYTQISQFEILIKMYNSWLYYTKEAAEKLIAKIQKEYHLSEKTPLEK